MKRQHENDESNQCEMQRTESSPEPIQPTKIIDVNNDCLEKIFHKLDLQSLFNVSIANEWLRPAAGEIYNSKFGTKLVKIFPFTSRLALKEDGNEISLCGLKTCLQYLRCFGSSISELSIEYKYSKTKRYDYVHQYIKKYCLEGEKESLKAISIDYSTSFGKSSSLKKVLADLWHGDCLLKCLKIVDHEYDLLGSKTSTWLDIIKEESSIVELRIDTDLDRLDSALVKRLTSEHPALIGLYLPRYHFTAIDALTLICQLKSLKKFVFRLSDCLQQKNT